MKKIIAYVISYLVVFTGMIALSGFYRHAAGSPYFNVKLHTTLSQNELMSKLKQIGLSAPSVQVDFVTYAPKLTSLLLTFFTYGLFFVAFLWFAYLIERYIFKSRPRC